MKPCVSCGKTLENDVETCPACGREASTSLGVHRSPAATDLRKQWSEEDRRTWLMGELRAALGVIFGNALKSIAFATTGALVGYLLGDLTGLAIGATLALVVGLVLF